MGKALSKGVERDSYLGVPHCGCVPSHIASFDRCGSTTRSPTWVCSTILPLMCKEKLYKHFHDIKGKKFKLLRCSRRAEFLALGPSVSTLGLWGHLLMRPRRGHGAQRGGKAQPLHVGYTSVRVLQELKVRIKKTSNYPLQIPDLSDSSLDKK